LCTNLTIDNYYNLQFQKYDFDVAMPMLAYFQSSNLLTVI